MRALFWEPEAFFSFPQNDPDKEYNMPKDGTVHELTSNVGATQTLLARWDKELSSSDAGGQHQWEPTLQPASSTQALSGSQSPEIALDLPVALVTVKTPGTRPARWLGRVCRKPLPWAYPRPSRVCSLHQAILFLQQLLDFQETAGAMLASQGTQHPTWACLCPSAPSCLWT